MFSKTAHSSDPSIFAWFFAIISALVFSILCLGLYDLSDYLAKNHALSAISKDSLEFPNARRNIYIKTLLQNSNYQTIYNLIYKKDEHTQKLVATQLFSALEQLISNHYKEAMLAISALPAEDFVGIEDNIEKMNASSVDLERRGQEIEDLERKIQSVIAQHALVANEFATMMSFHSAYAEAEKKAQPLKELLVYKNGILKDLPRLQELPDNIESLLQLKAHLEMLGGKVVTEGADAHTYFNEKLQELRDKSLALQQQFETFQKEREELSQLQQQSSAALQENQKNTKLELLKLALEHVR